MIGTEITFDERVKGSLLKARLRDELAERGQTILTPSMGLFPFPPLPSVAAERARIDAQRKLDNYARNHP